jgi:cytochrome P450
MQKLMLFFLLTAQGVATATTCNDEIKTPPRLSGFKAISFLKKASKDRENFLKTISDATNERSGILEFRIVPAWIQRIFKKAPPSLVIVADPDVTADVLRRPEEFERGYKPLKVVVGNSFFLKDDSVPEDQADWLLAHKAMVAGFSPRFIEQAYVPIMHEELARIETSWKARQKGDGLVENAQKELYAFSIRVGFRAFMSSDLSDAEAEEIGTIFGKTFDMAQNQDVRPRVTPLIDRAIAARPAQLDDALVLDRLLAAQRENGLDISWVHDQMITLLFAAQETTRYTLAMGMVELSRHPDWQSRVADDEEALAFVKEVLRLHSPVPVFPRRLLAAANFGGYRFRARDVFQIMPYALHRNPRVWGEDANEFKPERWLSDPKPEKTAMCAFGGGIRMCIGATMATTEIRLLLQHLAKTWSIAPIEGPIENGPSFGILTLKNPIHVRLTEK